MAKLFTEPLLVFCFFQIFLILRLLTHRRLSERKEQKKLALLFAVVFSILWLSSLPFVAALLERGLALRTDRTLASTGPIDVIAVLGAGYIRDPDPELDLISDEAGSRLTHAAHWWKKCPTARVVITGASAEDAKRGKEREAELSRDFIVNLGVPKKKITLETTATNTREHPTALLKLPGIDAETRIGIVTSVWHLRRAVTEFRHHFRNLVPYPYQHEPMEWLDWTGYLPRRSGLAYSTTLIHEYLGLVWYQWMAAIS